MKEFQNLNQEEQVDLRIVEHLDMQNLPESIQTIRWNNQWIEKGMVRKENHGEYRKVA